MCNKVKSNNPCQRFKSFDNDGNPIFVDKIKYNTDKEAIEAARQMNIQEKVIHKLVAYKCPVCHYWHIGRNKTVLSPKDKNHYKNVIK
jgi:hypothetical protein